MRAGVTLTANNRPWVPDAIKKHWHHSDSVRVGNLEHLLYTVQECFAIGLPKQVVQKDSHAVHAELLGRPAQLTVNRWQM
ncbi:unannotated protein [freshwater metagenome]|uniref:Unannotated protein n=1 Tax=freshwater metagenome TaxID=449393 RepID=A0A6J6Q7K6_9ZZZZ